MPPLLLAYPNPFAFLDHEGQPAGTFPFDPDHAQGARRWVGARIDISPAADGKPKTRAIPQPWDMSGKARIGKTMQTVRVGSAPDQRTVYVYDLTPQALPDSEHYVRGLRDGSLIPADAPTASRCRVAFLGADAALCVAASKAIAEWVAHHGEAPPIATWPEVLKVYAAAPESPSASPDDDEATAIELTRVEPTTAAPMAPKTTAAPAALNATGGAA